MSKLAISNKLQYSKVSTNETKKDSDKTETIASYGYGIRHIQLIIFFLCLVISFIARGHLGVTLVAMTTRMKGTSDAEVTTVVNKDNYTNLSNHKYLEDIGDYGLNATDTEAVPNVTIGSNVTEESRSIYSTFSWTKPIQEMVLTSFFMGYCLMLMPVSLVCQRWGGKVPLQVSMFVNGVVSILTPSLAYWGGWKAVCVCRLLQGFSQAGTYPGLQTLLAQWVPDCEKSTLTSYVYTAQTGMASALIGASYASNTTIAVTWFVIFMVSQMGIHTGWMINQIDLTPNYSGTMIAISSCITNVVVMIMPFLISNIIVDLENVFQWRIMLFLEAAIALIPAIIFAVYISDEVQPWNDGNVSEGDVKLESLEKNEVEKNVADDKK